MIRLWGILFALIVAGAAAFIITSAADSFTQKLEGHIAPRPENIEAPARYFGGHADAGESFFNHGSYLVLLRGSEAHT